MSIEGPIYEYGTPQLIDEKITHLENCIRQLKSQRNGLAPISKLPPEILARIFFFTLAGVGVAGRTRTPALVSRYNFSHVSGSWRSIALNTPNLWQVLPNNLQWATAMLERSKGADLVVEAYVDSRRSSFITEVLTKHTSRIRELDLSASELPTLFENLQQSSLRLHSLKLKCPSYIGDRPDPFPTRVIETTNLQTLSVSGFGGPWFSLSLPALTNLKLHNIPDRPPLIEFLEMLRGLTSLDVLDMEDSLPFAANDLHGVLGLTPGPIKLPLSYLCLSSTRNYKEVTNILSVITVPRTATLKLIAGNRLATTQERELILGELASSLTSFFCRHTDLSYRNLLVSSPESGLHLKAWKDDEVISATPHLELSLTLNHTSYQGMLRPIIPSIPLSDITTLTLDDILGHTVLKDTFGQFSRLRNIKVIGDSTPAIIQALISKPKRYNTKLSAYHSVSFPALESLWIDEFSFKENGMCTVEELQDCLMERCERNAEILKLKLTQCCELWYDNVESLRHIVVDVEWDESEESDYSDEGDSDDSEEDDFSEDDLLEDDYYGPYW